MIRLFVAEKPSVARDLADALGARTRRDIHLEGDGVWVTWCIGHLVTPANPDAHDPRWRSWDAALLPILPRQLVLEPIKRTRGHFTKLKRLLRHREVGEIVNACDAGREGELIFRYVYGLAGATAPTLRFWVSSLTPSAIRAGLSQLRPGADFDALGDAARCRAEADWLVGMNGTRGLTALGGSLLSVGRVQTPTLALIVDREGEIEAFVVEPYWEIYADLGSAKGGWRARWIGSVGQALPKKPAPRGRLGSAEDAAALAAHLEHGGGQVTVAERDRQSVPPPQLHHLTSLQREANRRFGLTADQTLKAAQALYERHKLLTYPRTDSRHLTPDVARALPEVVAAVNTGPWAPIAGPLLRQGLPTLGRRVVDASKVGDHHALLPTAVTPQLSALPRDAARIYELVVRRLLAALSPAAIYARTRLEVEVRGERLEARGRVRLEAGWERAEPPARDRKAKGAAPNLPAVEVGDAAQVEATAVERKETRPPPRFTEATLLGAMEHAGRSLDDAALRAVMREAGLGTPATRAATLETLLRRGYLRREARALCPTPLGAALVDALPAPELKSAALTAEWERRLQAIAERGADAMSFRRDIRAFVRDIVNRLRAAPPVSLPEGAAPPRRRGRGAGHGASKRGARRRSGDQGADHGARKKEPRRSGTRTKATAGPAPCPACGEGVMMRGARGWGCDRWRAGCAFVIWFEHQGVTIPDEEADRLFRRGKTRLFARPEGAPRRARLVLEDAQTGRVRWELAAKRRPRKAKEP